MRYALPYIIIFIIGCHREPSQTQLSPDNTDSTTVIDTTSVNISYTKTDTSTTENYNYQTVAFELIKQFPHIKDTAYFINELVKNCHISDYHIEYATINYFKRTKLYGSDKEYYIVEYDFVDGASCSFPWKNQFIFDRNGILLKALWAIRIDIVKIFPDKNPFLFTLSSTARGNGWHEVFRIQKDTIEQVYDGFLGYKPQTYCTGYDNDINEPNELHHKFSDENKDGYNDIIFWGKVRYSKFDLGVADHTVQVKYVFLYNPVNRHFTEQEDYSKKYEFIYGDTK